MPTRRTPAGLTAVFLDRDGVINRNAPNRGYVTSWDEFVFLPGALEGLRVLAQSTLKVVIATNQRGLALGRMTAEDLTSIHGRMLQAIAEAGGRVDAMYHCPHDEGCDCRKPEVGMFQRAAEDLGLSLATSAVVGDSPSDMLAAERIGALRVFVGDREGPDADHHALDLADAARWLTSA